MSPQSNPVSWFEIPVNDLQRAKNFYEQVFGVTLSVQEMGALKMAWFPMAQGGAGAAGALVKAESYVPSHAGTMVYFTVSDIDATLQRVEKNGGKLLRSKMSIGQHGYVGHFEDCEGNRIALHSM